MGKKKGKKRTTNNNGNKTKKPMATLPPPSTPGTAEFNQGVAEDAASISLPASYSQDSIGSDQNRASNNMITDLLVSASVETESGGSSPVKTPKAGSLLPEDLISTAMNATADLAPATTQSTTSEEAATEIASNNGLDETFYTTAMGETDESDEITDDEDEKLQGDLINLDYSDESAPEFQVPSPLKKAVPVATATSPPASSRKPRARPGNSFWTEAMATNETPKISSRSSTSSEKLDEVATMKEISAAQAVSTPKVAPAAMTAAAKSPAPYDEVSSSTPEKTEGTPPKKKKTYDGKEPDVCLCVYDGAKGAWAWSKSHVPLAGFVLGVTETVASSIVTAATGTNLRDMDEKVLKPHLVGFDTDVLNPAIHGVVDAILDEEESQNPFQKFVFSPLRPPVRALCNSQ